MILRVVVKVKVSWISAGVSSFIATYLVRDSVDKIVYIHINDQHEDSMRFVRDCEKVLGREIEILQHEKYKCLDDLFRAVPFINSPYGANCTRVLKKRVRLDWEKHYKGEQFTYVWGYDADEKNRADRVSDTMLDYEHEFPLIDRHLTKNDVHGLSQKLGVDRPFMYELGYNNNNCLGCVKGGMGYWNKIRIDFPHIFEERARQERIIGASCIKGIYLDELEAGRGRMSKEVMEECGILCELAYIEKRSE